MKIFRRSYDDSFRSSLILTGDTRKIFVSKTVIVESNSARVLHYMVGYKLALIRPIRTCRTGLQLAIFEIQTNRGCLKGAEAQLHKILIEIII